MADSINITTDELIATAQKVRSINETLDTKLQSINKEMNNLNSTYQSDAATEIISTMNALKPRFEEYKQVVESYAKFLEKTAGSYEATESAILSNISQFK